MSKIRCLFAVLACVALSSCVADRLKFWDSGAHKTYAVSGLDDQEEIGAYIRTIIDEGFAEPAEDAEDIAYLQEAVRLDVLKAMRAKGYYDAAVAYEDEGEEAGRYQVEAGALTIISAISVRPAEYEKKFPDLGIAAGDALDAAKVLTAQGKLLQKIQKESCAYDLDIRHSVILDPATRTAEIIFRVEEGKPAAFGALKFSGMESVDQSYIDKLITWDEGACFKHEKLAAVRDKLLGTGLFSRADAVLPSDAAKRKDLPVEFVLKERAQRTLSAGLSYYTDEGVGAIFGWEHRNFLGSGEKFNADLTLSMLEQTLETNLTKPYFLRNDQTLSLSASVGREDTDAYERLSIGTGFSVKRTFSKYLSGRAGMDFELTRITEENESADNFALLSPIAALTFDSRNDTLDPHKGSLVKISVEPAFDVLGESDPFVKNKFTAQTYYEAHKRLVLAGRINLGSIIGSSSENLPASERFFAGGGGSVRGFGYQEVGPHDSGDPAGGRSLVEGSFELRYKATDTLGGVAFIDVGQVTDKVTPSVDNLAIGAGLGFRYYTDFGPLRFDVGVPLKGDENTDANFQVYISIGQAF
tara:strand:- start:7374 stop:9125 length:1752 start_codon:yes stop_codon:yes gene_type:complete